MNHIIAADGKRCERRSDFEGSKRYHFVNPNSLESLCKQYPIGGVIPSADASPCVECLHCACKKPNVKSEEEAA